MVALLLGLHVRALTNSALLLFAQVQTDRVDTIVGQDQELNHARAVQEQQRKQVKVCNIWVRPIICTRAAPTDLELASNVEPSLATRARAPVQSMSQVRAANTTALTVRTS